MDKQRCRYILRACRANGADANDPLFREALAIAQKDPKIAAWLERERLIDRTIADKLREVSAPDELRQNILDGAAVSSAPKRWRTAAAIAGLGLAAAAAITIGVQRLFPDAAPPPNRFDLVLASAFDDSRQPITPSYYAASISDLRGWLAHETAPAPGDIPAALAELPTIGCKTVDWSGVPSSVVCFRAPALYRDEEGHAVDRVMHLYTIDQKSCSGGSAEREPITFAREDQSVATWRDTDHFYVLVVKAPERALREFLEHGIPLGNLPDGTSNTLLQEEFQAPADF